MNSIPLENVPEAVGSLLDSYHRAHDSGSKKVTQTDWRELTSNDLQAVIKALDPSEATAYKAGSVKQLFSPQEPDVVLSYRWSATLGSIYDGLCSVCTKEELVWIDILFNPQNAVLTSRAVLEITPRKYQRARRHVLLVTSEQVRLHPPDKTASLWSCLMTCVCVVSGLGAAASAGLDRV